MASDATGGDERPGESAERTLGRIAKALRRFDTNPKTVKAAQAARRMLPGDTRYGDPLSVAGTEPPQLLGQRLAEVAAERPSAMREVGLSALQVWQALSEAEGGGPGDIEVAILFTDLVEFSSWALEAGDGLAVELLRRVGEGIEPPIEARGGRVVKRLGDGLMAVFDEPGPAVEAALEAATATAAVTVEGYHPCLRAGVHFGAPQKLGGDYLGVDVNVAARVAASAKGDEVLVSATALERMGEHGFAVRKKGRMRAKGAPKDLEVYAVSPA